jgi:2-amino-4-hydroxy-6-hydroxymethyldihydropteridine diphosphokinase
MSLVLSTGTNLGSREQNLLDAKSRLENYFKLIACSNIYQSPAVDYLDQPDFLNQVLEFELPNEQKPESVLQIILEIELEMGRRRDILKGPRTLDIDILFWGLDKFNEPNLTIPHPRLFERSFIVKPLFELPFAATLKNHFQFPKAFSNTAEIFSSNA